MFSDDVINRVRDGIDIVDLVSGYVSLKKTGKNYVGLCPFHSEKTPSFSVNPDKQIFHCFGCGVGGDAFKFVEMQEGLNFPEAVKKLAAKAGVTLPAYSKGRAGEKKDEDERKILKIITAEAASYFHMELAGPAGGPAREYLHKRGLSDQIIKDFSIGFSRPEWEGLLHHLRAKGHKPEHMEKAGLVVKRAEGEGYYDRFRGRVIFPIRDISGSVIAFGGRVMDGSLPKYMNSPETPLYSKSNVLYCLDAAKDHARKLGYFIIVEGYLDAVACHQFGVRNAVATLGTALTEGHMRLMRRFSQKLVLIFDPDPAGVKAAMRGLDLFTASGMKVNVVSLPGGDDPDTFLHKNGAEAFSAELRKSVKFMDFALRQVVGSAPPATIDEKVARASEMLALIAKIPSGIERDHYIKRTAEALDVEEALLRQEMPGRSGRAPQKPGSVKPQSSPQGMRPRAEEILLHLMLRDKEIALHVRSEIMPEEFTDTVYQRAAQRIYDAIDEGKALDAGALFRDGDAELNSLIAHYSVLDADYSDPRKTCLDCVERIRDHRRSRKMKTLVGEIKEAEARGDSAELRRLLEEQQNLVPGKRVKGGV